jgi:FAD synthase
VIALGNFDGFHLGTSRSGRSDPAGGPRQASDHRDSIRIRSAAPQPWF